ncbi:uncharacterized protein B0H18DRAFT_274167 [Fomitopsis serialis]|uniref:uncharacterized protein n=1 Tax=Fomitopsis serialis TaxID=139415 RepID=UPI002007E2F3|nr:uncharacterized protein B0H18DRAFT_97998 [Neoantrodia serialis]XP_047894462.1 uncharacterized protein B0H18DRAFT_274167 [Neoantrodia serialis]KAH9915424.1 hypothetical protein B0H18DRAFT_97998 [Neoantrodia serialis]KAH9927819.1 hypothetical protein B0H18DRAFT_274167 [Neoantrodia serialis]
MNKRTSYFNASASITRKRHERFYLSDGNVIFQAEDTLFKIHRYFFLQGSKVFEDMFSLPSPPGEDYEGGSDDRPVYLEGTTSLDLARFLTIFYPRSVCKPDLETTDEWASVLALAVKWQFDDVQALAVVWFSANAPLVDQILLARAHRLAEWLYDAHVRICSRYEPLSLAEGRRLGVDEAVVISDVRQYSIRCNRGNVDHDKLRAALRLLQQQ